MTHLAFPRRAFGAACLLLAGTTSALAGTARLDCGGNGGNYGARYTADQAYSTANGAGAVGGTASTPSLLTNGQVIENTAYSPLVNSVREGMSEYRFDLPNGSYLLTLQFVELLQNGPNLRRFSVLAEGVPLLQDLDLYARFGRNYAVTYQFGVNVADGQLNVTFPASIGQATLSAISVQSIKPNAKAPRKPTDVAALGSYARNLITWPDQTDADLAGYLVSRGSSASGPFTTLTPAPLPNSRYFDDAVTTAVPGYYRVAAIDVFGNQSAWTSPVAATPIDRSQSTLPAYQLSIPLDQYAVLQANTDSDYVTADFSSNVGQLFAGIGVKFRGATSLNNQKKSWKVNFKKSAPFQGRDKLILKAAGLDNGLLTECLAAAQLAGVATLSSSCSLAHLEVNGEFMGVFSQLEDVDDDFFNARGINPLGQLLEAEDTLKANFRVLDDYATAWDDHSDNEDGYPALAALVQLVNDTPDADFARTMAAVLDVDTYLDYLATMQVIGDWDHVGHNYYMYRSPDSPLWEVIPKDFDQAFYQTTLSLLKGVKTTPLQSLNTYNVLTSRLLTVPLFRQQYVNKIAELRATQFTPALLSPRIASFHGSIADDGHRDVYKRFREDNTAFEASPAALNDFVTQRTAYIDAHLAEISPQLALPLLINEVLPDNRSGATTGTGAHSPWLELYNPGTQAYELTGHYLTNDPAQPTRWPFPAGLSVPAGGHLLVWLDEQTVAGEVHAPLALSPKGQALALYGPGNGSPVLLDTIAYRALPADTAWGRRSSGSALWARQAQPTPGSANTGPASVKRSQHARSAH